MAMQLVLSSENMKQFLRMVKAVLKSGPQPDWLCVGIERCMLSHQFITYSLASVEIHDGVLFELFMKVRQLPPHERHTECISLVNEALQVFYEENGQIDRQV
jgi:hypothetical protein